MRLGVLGQHPICKASFLNIAHAHKNSPCFGTKLYWGSNSVQKIFCSDWKRGIKKTLGSSCGFGGNWKQVTTGNKSNNYQVFPDTSRYYLRIKQKSRTHRCSTYSQLFLFSHYSSNGPISNCFPASIVFESQVPGRPRARKFVSGSGGWKGGYLLGGSGASAPHTGLFFLTLAPWLLFQARPLLRHDQPGKTRRSEGHRFLCYSPASLTKAESCITRCKFLGFHDCIHSDRLSVLVSLTPILWPRPLGQNSAPAHSSLSNEQLRLLILWSICVDCVQQRFVFLNWMKNL